LRITCGLWLLVFLWGCGRLSAFNLDTDNVQEKSGEPGSLFGFSLAMHRQLHPTDKRMLLVGAPRAKALSGQKSKVTGGLYNCDMSSTSPGCNRVVFDNDEDLNRESKENQWMGVTVSSQGPGGKILTCAHRYQRRANVNKAIESRDIIGRCYVLSQDLTINAQSGEDGGNWHFCDSRHRGHEMFGSCQQGLSAMFDKDYHYLIFGAPGAYNWKGVVRLEQKNDTFIELDIFDDGPFEAGDEREKNPDLVPAPPNSYMGFSLDSGKSLTKKGQLTVVAGAPRANHSGAVILLKKGPSSKNILLEEYTLKGEGLASSFGYDLTVLDLNGDGWQDIVVGAPQYFEKNKEIGGAVYVFVNKDGNWNTVTPTRIEGNQDSMFGLAVENLGDINLDGYDDFAVGAPYDSDGAGAVYIYSGSSKGLSSKKSVQVLNGKAGVKLFGYSLAGNMDLDKNSYPDLAVGSLSDSVFVTRPVVSIKKEIKFSPPVIDLSKKNCGNTVCLEIEACFSYTANPKSYAPRLTYHTGSNPLWKISLFSPDQSALWAVCVMRCDVVVLQENIKDKLNGISVDVSVDIQDAKRKRRQSSGPLPPVLDSIEPTREEVHFLKKGCGSDNKCRSNLKVTYRYGQKTSQQDKFTPLKMEGDMPLMSLSDQKNIALEVTVTNEKGDDAYEASVIASLPHNVGLFLSDIFSHTHTYQFLILTGTHYLFQEGQVTCSANTNGTLATCELGNPFKFNSQATFYLILGTAGISFNTTEVEIDLKPETTSTQENLKPVKAKAKVAIALQLSVSGQAHPSQAYFTGEVKGEAAMKVESDIGSAITHHFRIINLGRRLTDLGTATLNIGWPKYTAQGKWLLYLMKISSTGVDHIECTPKDEINNLRLVGENISMMREENEEGTISRFSESKSKILSCEDGAQCVTIKCPLRGLDSNAVITLHSRLWNSTFIEVTKCFYLTLRHSFEMSINSNLLAEEKTVLQNAETKVRLTVFPERRAGASYAGVPWWIIVLSILFGLLLLALLAFLLWKCGFFERAKYEDKVPSYNAVRIKREERVINPGNGNWENLEKKPWMTTWHDKEHYS
uniref:Integrin, alpha 6b n=1 Tax=Lates calcarifer TaxID=8187 RepID=A0A4W6F017_LATCA